MLADPEFIEAETVAFDRHLDVLLEHRMGVAPVIVGFARSILMVLFWAVPLTSA